MKILIAAAALLVCAQAAAQPLNKCRDAAGKVTYASQPCDDLGLKPGGEIRERSSVAPAYKAPPASAASKAKPAPAAAAAQEPAAKVEAAKEEQDRRCFKTAKGMRCNDDPDKKK